MHQLVRDSLTLEQNSLNNVIDIRTPIADTDPVEQQNPRSNSTMNRKRTCSFRQYLTLITYQPQRQRAAIVWPVSRNAK